MLSSSVRTIQQRLVSFIEETRRGGLLALEARPAVSKHHLHRNLPRFSTVELLLLILLELGAEESLGAEAGLGAERGGGDPRVGAAPTLAEERSSSRCAMVVS